MLIVVSIR